MSGIVSRLLAPWETASKSLCYQRCVFNFGKPKSAGDWIAHVILGVVALFLIWWMMHMFV